MKDGMRLIQILLLATTLSYLNVGCVSVSSMPQSAMEIDFQNVDSGKTGWSKYEQHTRFGNIDIEHIYEAARHGLASRGFTIKRVSIEDGVVIGEHGITAVDWNVVAGVYFKSHNGGVDVYVLVEGSKDIGIWGDATAESWTDNILYGMRRYLASIGETLVKGGGSPKPPTSWPKIERSKSGSDRYGRDLKDLTSDSPERSTVGSDFDVGLFEDKLRDAKAGDTNAMNVVSFMYANGKGVIEDGKEAIRWCRKAAELGNMKAMNDLGLMYETGESVIEDNKEAVKWFRKAAKLGDWKAMTNLGHMYDQGKGVIEDHKVAAKWYRKSANLGDARAMTYLGIMYATGEGVLEDDKEAAKWYRKAAELGFADAMVNLGAMYANGEGVIEDSVEAYAWFNVAAARGISLATDNRDIIKKHMTAQQIAEGQKLSREIMKYTDHNRSREIMKYMKYWPDVKPSEAADSD